MEVVAEQAHRQTAELHNDIGTFGDLADRRLPGCENFLAPVSILSGARRAAAMVEHDSRIRKRAGEIRELADLRMKQPGIETQAQRRETGKSLAKGGIQQQAFGPRRVHAGDLGIGIPG